MAIEPELDEPGNGGAGCNQLIILADAAGAAYAMLRSIWFYNWINRID